MFRFIEKLPNETIDGVVSDPPFGENMGYDGDNSINEAEELMYSYLKLLEPKLKKNSHIALFWTMRNLLHLLSNKQIEISLFVKSILNMSKQQMKD